MLVLVSRCQTSREALVHEASLLIFPSKCKTYHLTASVRAEDLNRRYCPFPINGEREDDVSCAVVHCKLSISRQVFMSYALLLYITRATWYYHPPCGIRSVVVNRGL